MGLKREADCVKRNIGVFRRQRRICLRRKKKRPYRRLNFEPIQNRPFDSSSIQEKSTRGNVIFTHHHEINGKGLREDFLVPPPKNRDSPFFKLFYSQEETVMTDFGKVKDKLAD